MSRIRMLATTMACSIALQATVTFALEKPTTQPAQTSPAVEQGDSFVRVVKEPESKAALQTGVKTFRNPAGVEVDLVAAVHVGEPAYYDALNDRFHGYSKVLYEMIKPIEAAPPEPNAKRSGIIGMIQTAMSDGLGLQYQLDGVNYKAANFVHADMDPTQFFDEQEKAGESLIGMMLEMMVKQMLDPQEVPQSFTTADLVQALTAPDRERQLKSLLAEQLTQMDVLTDFLEGPDGSVILTRRNEHAMKILAEQLKDAKPGDRIAVFYGAAHLPGMQKILENELGFKPVGEMQYLNAWDLAPVPGKTAGH